MTVTSTGSWNRSAQFPNALLEVMTVLAFSSPNVNAPGAGGHKAVKEVALLAGDRGIPHLIHHYQR